MTIFKIDDNTYIECVYRKTRNGFRHSASLYKDGRQKYTASISYLNRTWESFEFESVLQKILDKAKYPEQQKESLLKIWKKDPSTNGMNALDSLASIMKMGEFFAPEGDKKAANDWKARMLKAGVPDGTLLMPEDWDTLSEDEKQRRLDGVIGIFKGK
jgi:hypothetical protein